MTGLLMTFGIFLAAGLFFVTADVVGLPTMVQPEPCCRQRARRKKRQRPWKRIL